MQISCHSFWSKPLFLLHSVLNKFKLISGANTSFTLLYNSTVKKCEYIQTLLGLHSNSKPHCCLVRSLAAFSPIVWSFSCTRNIQNTDTVNLSRVLLSRNRVVFFELKQEQHNDKKYTNETLHCVSSLDLPIYSHLFDHLINAFFYFPHTFCVPLFWVGAEDSTYIKEDRTIFRYG